MSLPGQESEADVAGVIAIVGWLDICVVLSSSWSIIRRCVGTTGNESQVTTHSFGASASGPISSTFDTVVWHVNLPRLPLYMSATFSRLAVGGLSSPLLQLRVGTCRGWLRETL